MRKSYTWASTLLAATMLVGCGASGSNSSEPTTTQRPTTTTTLAVDVTTTGAAPTRRDVTLEFRPVLGIVTSDTCTGQSPTPTSGFGSEGETGMVGNQGQFTPPAGSDTTVTSPDADLPDGTETFLSSDGAICYFVGPASASQADLASAEPTKDPNGWTVAVSITPAGRDRINALFNDCYTGSATCPGNPGAVAIVVDSKVISAPAVNAKDLANDVLTISGDFTEGEAENLALSLRP